MSIASISTMINFEVEYDTAPYTPAYISGPPENCSPAEGGEIIKMIVRWCGVDVTNLLSDDERDAVEDEILYKEGEQFFYGSDDNCHME